MINLLVKYAKDQGLVIEPGFSPKGAKWAIACGQDGRFLDVVQLGDASQKKNPGQRFRMCPHLLQPDIARGPKGESRRHFLLDKAAVVALYDVGVDDEKLRNKHDYFVGLLRNASKVMPELGLIADTLTDVAVLTEISRCLRAQKAKANDYVTFFINGGYPVESDAWHEWWRGFRASLQAGGVKEEAKGRKGLMRCMATGEMVLPAPTHPPIKGLSKDRVPLISFDKEAYRSYGLEQAANAAVSEVAATAYGAALNHLIEKHGQKLAGAVVTHWFAGDVPGEDDPLSWLTEPPVVAEMTAQRRATKLLGAIRAGRRPDLLNSRYYALSVSHAPGRVMVRDWMEGSFEALVESVGKWFSDMEIVALQGGGNETVRSPKIERVITCLLPPQKPRQKYEDWIKPVGSERMLLWRAALYKDAPIPFSALARVVQLNTRFHQTAQLEETLKSSDKGKKAMARSLLYRRMGLMKAYNIRKQIGGVYMKPYLNEEHPHPAYHCGRLMAVLAGLQRSALGDVGAGVVQRYYGSASSTPALVLGRLVRTSQFHLSKLEGGLGRWYDEKIAFIWGRIKDEVPRVLTLEEQSLFALGYYQQMAADWPTKKEGDVTDNIDNEEENNE